MAAVQVLASGSTALVAADPDQHRKVKIANLGPNPIWVEIGAAAVVATSYKITNGTSDTFDVPQAVAVNAIASTADQVSPADTRVLVV